MEKNYMGSSVNSFLLNADHIGDPGLANPLRPPACLSTNKQRGSLLTREAVPKVQPSGCSPWTLATLPTGYATWKTNPENKLIYPQELSIEDYNRDVVKCA